MAETEDESKEAVTPSCRGGKNMERRRLEGDRFGESLRPLEATVWDRNLNSQGDQRTRGWELAGGLMIQAAEASSCS